MRCPELAVRISEPSTATKRGYCVIVIAVFSIRVSALESFQVGGIRSSMGAVCACWDNAVVERFFGSLKHDWIFKVAQPTRDHMKSDVAAT